MVKHDPHHTYVKDLSPAAPLGTWREMNGSGSTVVEHLPQHPKVNSLRPADVS
jgi:hypothetical protein